MFHQILAPVADNLFLSIIVGFLPIIVVLVLLGVVRLPAWQAALAGLIVGLIIAMLVWQMPVGLAASATLNGFAFALVPIMWIVWNAMWLYNIAVRSGKFDLFRRWMVYNVPPDKRILLLLIGFSFGALLEGIAGFGTPVAIGSALLIGLGFPMLEAVTLTLIFNTTPVAFGALGVPIVTLAGVTGLHIGPLSAMVGRQLPIFALFLPFYAMVVFTGFRSLRTAWPVALVAGVSFSVTQFVVSNFVGPELPDVLASLASLVCLILFVQVWQPRDIETYRATFATEATAMSGSSSSIGEEDVPVPESSSSHGVGRRPSFNESLLAWLAWLLVSVVVIVWTFLKVPTILQQSIKWPGLHNLIFLTLCHKPYAAIYNFQPLGTGTAILLAMLLTAIVMIFAGSSPAILQQALADTWKQLRFAILTVVLIIGLAYLYNYSGMAYTLGLAISKVGATFPFFAVFLGWIACGFS
jgi:lactate permease